MLVIWTGADDKTLRSVVGEAVAIAAVEHRVESNMNVFPECEPGDFVLACGTKALNTLVSMSAVPKNRTLNSLREREFAVNGIPVFLTFDPGIVSRDYARQVDIQWDVQLIARRIVTGTTKPPMGDYRYVESYHELVSYIVKKNAETGKRVDVACDLETVGLDEYAPGAYIVTISMTVEDGKADVMYFEKGEVPKPSAPWESDDDLDYWQGVWRQIHWILTSPLVSVRGANFKFDSRWINKHWAINCTNQQFDTVLVGSLLDENRSNSLKLHAKIYTQMGGYEEGLEGFDKGRMDLIPREVILPYTGGDTDVTYKVAIQQKKELLRDKALTNLYVKLIQPSAKVFEKMERNGILIDRPYFESLEKELNSEISRLESEMLAMLPNKLRIKYRDEIKKQQDVGKSPLKPAILREFFFSPNGLNLIPQMHTEKTGEPSITADHLMMFRDVDEVAPFIKLYGEHTSASKTLSTFVVGFMKHLRSDGRFHPSFLLAKQEYGNKSSGTDTGRTSAKDPAVQTIPKHTKWTKKLRRGYIAPPGYVILQLDYSQGELRITACVAEEPTMIQAYKDGADLHAITAAQLNGYAMDEFMLLPEDVRDELRSGGKAGNFGLIYGMQHRGFRDYAFYSYGVSMTEKEAFEKREAFFELYSRLPDWHMESKNFAHMNGFIRSPLGRVRHLPQITSKDSDIRSQAERQSVNSPIQSCLSDMMQYAMVKIDEQYGHEDIHMFLMTHDSLDLYVPEDDYLLWAKRTKEVMENLPLAKDFGWDPQLKFIADAECALVGDHGYSSLDGLKKLKNL